MKKPCSISYFIFGRRESHRHVKKLELNALWCEKRVDHLLSIATVSLENSQFKNLWSMVLFVGVKWTKRGTQISMIVIHLSFKNWQQAKLLQSLRSALELQPLTLMKKPNQATNFSQCQL